MAHVDTGLGWYLDEDYLLTVGNTVMGTIETSGNTRSLSNVRGANSRNVISGYATTTVGEPLFFIGAYELLKHNSECGVFAALSNVSSHSYCWVGVSTISADAVKVKYGANVQTTGESFVKDGITYYLNTFGWDWGIQPYEYVPTINYENRVWNINSDFTQNFIVDLWNNSSPISSQEVVKVQGGAGAFCFVSYPHDGDTVYVGVGISSIGIPNSAATVAVDGVNGSYNTFNREGMQFTMFYTEQLTGELTASVPVVVLDTDISGLPGVYEPRLFLAAADAAQIHVGDIDPYSGAGESEPGAEEATFDFDSTAVDFGTPPTVTAAGMVELYIPSTSDLASLAQYLWAGSFDPDNFKKLFADPMDAIIGLQIVPVTATEIGTTPDTLYVGNISTGLSMPKASRQYVPVDCGSLSIPRRLGSYLDYSPHTEMQLYLPYIGFVDISPDDCMGGTVSVKYMVDIIGGTCVAQVKCNDHVLYEYAAACSCQVPVSAGQYQNIVLGAVRGAIGLTSGVLGAAGGGLFSGLSEAADAALSMTKPKIQRSGGFGGSSGLMGHQTPYIIYTVPRLIVPGRQNNFIGYPSYITRTLGDLTGYTQIDSIHLSGIPASQSEQAEIEQLLQEGVYL